MDPLEKNKSNYFSQIQTHQVNSKNTDQNYNFSKIKNKIDEELEKNYHKKNKDSLSIKYTDFSSPNFKYKDDVNNFNERFEDSKKEKSSLIDKTKSIFINNNFKYNDMYNDLLDVKSKNIPSNYSHKLKNE